MRKQQGDSAAWNGNIPVDGICSEYVSSLAINHIMVINNNLFLAELAVFRLKCSQN